MKRSEDDETPDRRLVQLPRPVPEDPEASPGPESALGGLGLAAYAGLLAFLCLAGFAGMGGATLLMLNQGGARYSELKSGSEIAVWRLAPMREAGLLAYDGVPLAWHDESDAMDGTTACALLADAVVRVEGGQGSRLAFADIGGVELIGVEKQGTTVVASGGSGELLCTFGPEEGGERFARQLRSAAGLGQ